MTRRSGRDCRARPLAPGLAGGAALVLDEPLSFWGGVDPVTGRIIDRRHPQTGALVAGRILVLPAGRGSGSSSSVLAEAIRRGTAPLGIVLREVDLIIALGVEMGAELYGRRHPVVVLPAADYAAIRTGDELTVEAGDETATVRWV